MFLVFLGSAVIGGTSGAGRHSLDVTEGDVSEYIRDADVARVWVGEYVAVVGYALFVFFAAYVWSVVRRPAERDWRDGGVVSSRAQSLYAAVRPTIGAALRSCGSSVNLSPKRIGCFSSTQLAHFRRVEWTARGPSRHAFFQWTCSCWWASCGLAWSAR